MEALFANLLQLGQGAGLPLVRARAWRRSPGFEQSPAASLWNRLGAFLYRHGESVYHFQGLRAYKEKFDPGLGAALSRVPGGMRLPRILADVSALVAGGYRRIFS